MTPEIEALPFDQLRTLHREIGALIAERRHKALEELKEKAAVLGFTPADFVPQKTSRQAKVKYADGNGNTWSGKGRKPTWVQALEGEGRDISEFAA
jgi:DNA-binding protein H-NS